MNTTWTQVESLLDRVLDAPEEERIATLESLTRDYPEPIVDEVRRLLAGLERHGDLLDRPALQRVVKTPTENDIIGGWKIVRTIGSGGQADVFSVEHLDESRPQRGAMKVLRGSMVDAGQTRRFIRERSLLAGLQHPGIPTLLDGGVLADGTPWLVTEHVNGVPMDQACASRTIEQVVRLLDELCRVLAYAHGQLIVHRDLKPSNVLIDDEGRVRLLDFGIARFVDPQASAATGSAFTPAFAAPEQLRNERAGVAEDVYGLGALAYCILAGRPPFVRADAAATMHAVLYDAPDRAEGLDRDLRAIIEVCLRKVPGDRYSSMAAVSADLRNWLVGRPVDAVRGGTGYRLKKWVYRQWRPLAVATLGMAVTAAYLVDLRAQRARVQAEQEAAAAQAARAQSVVDYVSESLLSLSDNDPETTTVTQFLLRAAEGLDNLQDPVVRFELTTLLTGLLGSYNNMEQAERLARAGLAEVDRNPVLRGTKDHAEMLRHLAQILVFEGNYKQAEHFGNQARLYALKIGAPEPILDATNIWTWTLFEQGRGEEAREALESAVQGMGALNDPDSISSLGMADMMLGRMTDDTERRYAIARRALERILTHLPENRGQHVREYVFAGAAAQASGRLEEALHFVQGAVESGEAADRPELTTYARTQVALLARELGDLETARLAIDRAAAILAVLNSPGSRANLLVEGENLCLLAAEGRLNDARLLAARLSETMGDGVSAAERLVQTCIGLLDRANSALGRATQGTDDVLLALLASGQCTDHLPGLRETIAPYEGHPIRLLSVMPDFAAVAYCDGDAAAGDAVIAEIARRAGHDHWLTELARRASRTLRIADS